MNVFGAIKLALMVWSFTKLELLTKRIDELEIEMDNLAIDATKSDLMRIRRLAKEKQRIDQLLDLADAVFSEKYRG